MRASPLRIRYYRHRLGLTRREAATRAGVTAQTWYNIESGRTQGSARTLRCIAESLGVDIESVSDLRALREEAWPTADCG